jgi:hypothetical protein
MIIDRDATINILTETGARNRSNSEKKISQFLKTKMPLSKLVTASWQYCHRIVAVGSRSCAMGAFRIRHA